MSKKYSRGNREAQRYRAKVRTVRDWTVYAPWGKPLFDGRGGRPPFPPPGWIYWENQFGRGFISPHSLATPYDREFIAKRMTKKTPSEYKPIFIVKRRESHNVVSGKKGNLP